MRVLIDSHALIWYVDQDNLLSPASHAAISDPTSDRQTVVLMWSGVQS